VSGVGGGGDYDLREPEPVTPTKSQQNITPGDGYYGLKSVTVKAIPEAYQDVTSVTAGAGDVLTGKIFVSADGTVTPGEMINNGAVNKTLDVTTITYTIPKGFHSGSGKVQLVLETKSVTPTKSEQKIKPSSGKVLSEVIVAPIPDQYQDVTPVTAEDVHVLEGYKIVDSTGTPVNGAMTNKGAISGSIDGLTTTSYTVPAGYHNGSGKVTLTSDIENALAAI
jgi:hypothetical protein